MTAPDSAGPEIEAARKPHGCIRAATLKRVPAPSSPETGSSNRELNPSRPGGNRRCAETDGRHHGNRAGRP